MATTRIMALHTGAGRSVAKALRDSIDYMGNPYKTEGGELISSYECDARTADAEFLLSKQKYRLVFAFAFRSTVKLTVTPSLTQIILPCMSVLYSVTSASRKRESRSSCGLP